MVKEAVTLPPPESDDILPIFSPTDVGFSIHPGVIVPGEHGYEVGFWFRNDAPLWHNHGI